MIKTSITNGTLIIVKLPGVGWGLGVPGNEKT